MTNMINILNILYFWLSFIVSNNKVISQNVLDEGEKEYPVVFLLNQS